MPAAELHECLTACYPLHPLTAIVLGPLFRQLAQNERSLFAFLASSEPFGFQEFLRETPLKDAAYRLDHLYDYVMASLGPSLFAQHRGKVWAEVQSALDRLHDASDLEVRLAKTIGLLRALRLRLWRSCLGNTLQAALRGTAADAEIEEAIQSLSRRSVIVFRRHTASYALWEGSDVDIDDRLQAGCQSVERDQILAPFLTRQRPHLHHGLPDGIISRRGRCGTSRRATPTSQALRPTVSRMMSPANWAARTAASEIHLLPTSTPPISSVTLAVKWGRIRDGRDYTRAAADEHKAGRSLRRTVRSGLWSRKNPTSRSGTSL